MENFRCYAPKETVKFHSNGDKPLTTFVGKIGTGKTTIFLAVIWALYGEPAIESYAKNRPNDKQAPSNNLQLMNLDVVENSPRPSMRVSLVFEHDSKKYTLRRSVSAKRENPTSNGDLKPEEFELKQLGKAAPEYYPRGIIEDILPFDASQFFFFDGEDIRRYSGAKEKLTHAAIELVLGIPEIREARNDTLKVQQKLLQRLREEPQVSENIKEVSNNLADAIEKVKEYGDALEAKKGELATVDSELLRAEIRRGELKEIADENAQLQKIISDVSATRSSIAENEKQRHTLVMQLPYCLITPQVRQTSERFRKISGKDDFGPQMAKLTSRVEILDELVSPSASECLCGDELDDNKKRHLLLLKRGVEQRIFDLRQKASKKTIPPIEDIQYVLGRLEGIQVDFKELERTINKLNLDLIDLDDKRLEIEKKIKGGDVEEAVRVQNLIEALREKKGSLQTTIESLQEDFNESSIKKTRHEGELRKAQREVGDIAVISRREQAASRAADAFAWIVEEISRKKMALIVQNTSEYFRTVAEDSGWKGVAIDPDYSIWLLNPKGNRMIPSEGWKELVALSLIYGLNKAANYSAPVLMDFVLGRLDSSRQRKVAENLNQFADQIILLLLDSEIQDEEVRSRIASLSSSEYRIVRDSVHGNSHLEISN